MATFGEVLNPLIKAETQEEADALFEGYVSLYQKKYNVSKERAEKDARFNLGYYAGYFSREIRKRVKEFYDAPHPGYSNPKFKVKLNGILYQKNLER